MIHIHSGGDWLRTKWFFKHIQEHTVPHDIIGLSYYPWWHGTLADLRNNLERYAATFRKDVFVVETAYPYHPFKRSDGDVRRHWQCPASLEHAGVIPNSRCLNGLPGPILDSSPAPYNHR